MKMSFCRTAAVLFMLVALSCSKQHPLENLLIDEPRESVLDRKVHLEKELVMNVPRVFRWCDTLGLKQHWISAGDAKLFVEEEGSGIPLVLINGGPGGTHHYFHPWFSRLKNVARVIYYDQRGCGRSDFTAGSQGYSVEQAVDDVDCIRQALGIDTWVVLGYSYGGFLAQYYAVKYPRHLAGLVMLGASPGMAVEVKPSRQSEFISAEENARMGEIRKTLTAMAEQRQWTQQELLSRLIYNLNLNGDWKRQNYYRPSRTRIAQMALYEWVNDTDFNSNLNTSEGMVDLTGAFQGFPSPTLILEGKWDLNWNTDHSDLLRSNHPGSTLVVFEHAAHGIYDEEPDRFFGVVGEFLQKLGPVSPEEINRYTEFVARK